MLVCPSMLTRVYTASCPMVAGIGFKTSATKHRIKQTIFNSSHTLLFDSLCTYTGNILFFHLGLFVCQFSACFFVPITSCLYFKSQCFLLFSAYFNVNILDYSNNAVLILPQRLPLMHKLLHLYIKLCVFHTVPSFIFCFSVQIQSIFIVFFLPPKWKRNMTCILHGEFLLLLCKGLCFAGDIQH